MEGGNGNGSARVGIKPNKLLSELSHTHSHRYVNHLKPAQGCDQLPMGAFHRSAMVVGVVATLKGGSGCSGGATETTRARSAHETLCHQPRLILYHGPTHTSTH